jgi:hypothetical protein
MAKKKLFSVGVADCRVDTFTVGGHGGSGKDTSNTGVRIVHEPSGAVGEARESRSQLQNKRLAFGRMADSERFRNWAKIMAGLAMSTEDIEKMVDRLMGPEYLRVEGRDENGKWVVLPD